MTERAESDAGGSSSEVTRRVMLRLGAAGMAGVTGMAVTGCGEEQVVQGGLAFAQRVRAPLPKPVPRPHAVTPQPVRRHTKPVHTLADYAVKPPRNAVALTIDDGPSPRWTPMVLEVLRRYRVAATFCVIGQQVRQHPEIVRRIVADGHALCNHTMTHPQLGKMSTSQIEHEVAGANEAIAAVTGVTPRVFRAPGGGWGPAIYTVLARHRMVPIDWSVDPQDWRRPGARTITTRLLKATAGEILLCHDGGGNRSQTVAALSTVIPALQRRGLRFVAL